MDKGAFLIETHLRTGRPIAREQVRDFLYRYDIKG